MKTSFKQRNFIESMFGDKTWYNIQIESQRVLVFKYDYKNIIRQGV